ncbi:MAG: YHS domain-containing protein [Phycisphaerae bacterium]
MKKPLFTLLFALSFVAMAAPSVRAEPATPPTTAPAAVDVKNTKCIVAKDDVGDSKDTVTYQGKMYHICCPDCKDKFNADPEKYVKALEKDPAAFGVKK